MSSPISLGGLISGMNTDDIIQKLSNIEAQRITTQQIRQQDIKNKQAAFQQIKSSFDTLRSVTDVIRQRTGFQARKATASDTSLIDVTASTSTALGVHSLTVTSMARAHVVQATSTASDTTSALGLTAGKLTVSGKSFDVTAADSLSTIRDKINASGANVHADIITVTNNGTTSYRMSLSATKLCTANAVTISDYQGGAIFTDPKLAFKTGGGAWVNEVTQATNAVFTLDNINFSMDTNTVTEAIPGLTFTIKKDSGTSSITVDQDTDATVSSIQAWVNQFNSTMSVMDNLTKVNLKDDTIDKSKQNGTLAGDSLVRGLQTSLRSMLSETVAGLPTTLNQLSQIGITTGKYGTADYGKVVLDTSKLTDQLQKDPDGVARIFGAITDVNTTGIAKEMYDYTNNALAVQTGTFDSRDAMYVKQIKDYDDRIARLNDHLVSYQATLKRQFTAMEVAMAKLNSQGATLMAQMTSMLGTSTSSSSSSSK